MLWFLIYSLCNHFTTLASVEELFLSKAVSDSSNHGTLVKMNLFMKYDFKVLLSDFVGNG